MTKSLELYHVWELLFILMMPRFLRLLEPQFLMIWCTSLLDMESETQRMEQQLTLQLL